MASPFQAIREYRLEPPGHPRGASCDGEGPVGLLVKTAAGFEPQPVEELNMLFTLVFARPIDCAPSCRDCRRLRAP
jgi:hypothetical protein